MKKISVIICVLFYNWLSAQLVTNGSITGAPCANSGINAGNAVGWSVVNFSPDLCCVAMPSYVTTSAVTPAVSPDGGTWLGIAALGECAQTTITGLTVSQTYTLYFCAACFGTGALYNTAPGAPTISVGTTSVTFSVPRTASTWYKYSMTFVAAATAMTLRCTANSGSNSYIDLDGFSLSPTSPCGPAVLPVEMMNFSAAYNANEKYVDLNWTVATEENVEYYAVERSENATEFFEISRVNSNLENYNIKKYSAIDAVAIPDKTNYYRIVAVDKDGQKEVSTIQEVMIRDKGAKLELFPNPAKNSLQLSFFSNAKEFWKLSFINSHGIIIEEKEIVTENNGNSKISFDISNYNSGLYFVNITNGKDLYKQKFIKE